MSGPVITLAIEGVERAITALKLADEDIGGRVRVRVAETGAAVVAGAKARVHKISGELEGTIRDEFMQDGLVVIIKVGYGSLKRRSRSKSGAPRRSRAPKLGPVEPGIYAMVVEFGDRNMAAQPYFFPAVDAAMPEHIAGLELALSGACAASGLAA